MTAHLDRAYEIIDEFDDKYKTELCEYYLATWAERLCSSGGVQRLTMCVLADLNLMFRKYAFLDRTKLAGVQSSVFETKILELRAYILDLVDQNYHEDIENVYRPEKWIVEVVKDLVMCFDLSDAEHVELFKAFNTLFLHEIHMIFISKNKRFGTNGNQLVLNLLFYKSRVDRMAACDFSEFFERIVQNFRTGAFKGMDVLQGVLDTHESPGE